MLFHKKNKLLWKTCCCVNVAYIEIAPETMILCLDSSTFAVSHETITAKREFHDPAWKVFENEHFSGGVCTHRVTHFSFSSLVRSSWACSSSCLSRICASCWSAISERMVCNLPNSYRKDFQHSNRKLRYELNSSSSVFFIHLFNNNGLFRFQFPSRLSVKRLWPSFFRVT